MACRHVAWRWATHRAIVCGPDRFVNLEPFGAKVWCEYHDYLGPAFFRSESASTEIRKPSRKTWGAFQRWRDSLQAGGIGHD